MMKPNKTSKSLFEAVCSSVELIFSVTGRQLVGHYDKDDDGDDFDGDDDFGGDDDACDDGDGDFDDGDSP